MVRKRDYSSWPKEDLIKRVEALEKRRKYGLVWDAAKEPEKVVLDCQKELPVLKEILKNQVHKDKDAVNHILIEGDNYHALSVLSYTHEKAVDLIYIDPPYNTGAQDWKYNNNYVDINDAYRHSKWLQMMSSRLKLAKRLLKDDGVLICSADENELNRLGLLLEDIFKNHEIHCITIVHNPRGVQGENFSYTHEYAYFVIPNGKQVIQEKKRKTYSRSNLNLRDKGGESLRTDARNCFYPFFVKDEQIVGIGEVPSANYHPKTQTVIRKDGIYEVWPIDVRGIERKWRYARQSVEDTLDILKPKKIDGGYEIEIYKEYEKYKTVWNDPEYNSSLYGTKLLHEILPDCDFDFPKSLYLERECLYSIIGKKKNAIVLDFFAGSGTTGHAVLDLNKEDGGTRQFILCTNNENNICTEVCYPRIKKVIKGYKNLKGQDIEGLGGNLKYYRTSFVPAEPTDKNKELLTKQSVEMLTLRENTFDFVTETNTYKIFNNREKYTGIIFDQLSIPEFKRAITGFDKPVSVYVFSLGDDSFAEEFEDMRDKVRVCSIPEAILRVYRRIFK